MIKFVLGLGFAHERNLVPRTSIFNTRSRFEPIPQLSWLLHCWKGAYTWIQGAYVLQCTYFYEWSKSQESWDIMSWSITIFYLLLLFFWGMGICLICCWHGMNKSIKHTLFFSFVPLHGPYVIMSHIVACSPQPPNQKASSPMLPPTCAE